MGRHHETPAPDVPVEGRPYRRRPGIWGQSPTYKMVRGRDRHFNGLRLRPQGLTAPTQRFKMIQRGRPRVGGCLGPTVARQRFSSGLPGCGDSDRSRFDGYSGRCSPLPIAVQHCKDGGWRTLTDASGQPFKNQGRCISYFIHNLASGWSIQSTPNANTGLNILNKVSCALRKSAQPSGMTPTEQ